MATAPDARPLAGQSATKIFNALRNAMSPQFQVRIPAATQGNIRRSIETIDQYPVLRDEFFNTFIQRLIGMYIKHSDYDNPLRDMGVPNQMKRYGGTYEQAAVGLIEARTRDYNKEYLGDDVYGRYRIPVKNYFHALNFNHYYPVTIPADAILTAFTDEGGMSEFIAEIMDAPIKSDRNDMYLMMCQCFAEYARQGGYYRIHTADVGASTSTRDDAIGMLRQIRTINDTLKATPISGMSKYNAAHWVIPWNKNDAVLFATPAVIAALDVEALAQMFNIDRAEIDYRIIPINPEQFGINGVQAILTTTDFWFKWDEIQETTNSPINPIDGSYNIFYKHAGSITPNPLANAILFWTGEGTRESIVLPENVGATKPDFALELRKYGNDSVIPDGVARGGVVQVVSEITVSNDPTFKPIGIEYKLEGNTSQFTKLDNEGILVCGLDETADVLKITAKATYIDPRTPEIDATTSVALNVVVEGEWVGGWSPALLTGLTVELDPQSVKTGKTLKARATATRNTGGEQDVTTMCSWTSSAPDVATVDTAGTVTGVKAGTAEITATFVGGITAKKTVTITA